MKTPKRNPVRVASRQISGFESKYGPVSPHSVYRHLDIYISTHLFPPLLPLSFPTTRPPRPLLFRLHISLQLLPRHPSLLSVLPSLIVLVLLTSLFVFAPPYIVHFAFDSFISPSVFPLVVKTLHIPIYNGFRTRQEPQLHGFHGHHLYLHGQQPRLPPALFAVSHFRCSDRSYVTDNLTPHCILIFIFYL